MIRVDHSRGAGNPYLQDNDLAGPAELANAIRARRTGGKLLNLDRILLHSPSYTRGWNSMFAAIRNQLALTYEMTRNITVADATMKRVRALLPDQQVVELAGTIAGYNMVSRFVVAIGIEME
jgi:hypothetical protein